MLINLKNCKVYIISPATDKYELRFYTVLQRVIKAGFNRVEFFRSVQSNHMYDSLTLTYIEIFKKELNSTEPFIILEDDCELWTLYETLEVPDDFSFLYLGVSKWAYPYKLNTVYLDIGVRPNITIHSFYTVKSYDTNLVKVRAMNSTHAVLYSSREFLKEFVSLFENLQKSGIPIDIFYSAIIWTHQDKYNVYALKYPMFYQDGSIGGQEPITKVYYNGHTYLLG